MKRLLKKIVKFLFIIFCFFIGIIFILYIFSNPHYIKIGVAEDYKNINNDSEYKNVTLESLDKNGNLIDSIVINTNKIYGIKSISFDKSRSDDNLSATIESVI